MNLKLRLFLLAIFSLISTQIYSQVPFDLYEQFNGSYDFTAIGNTLNTEENGVGGLCSILTQSSADLNLDADQTVEAAYLFWSGSGDGTGNFTIDLNDEPVTADETYSLLFPATAGALLDIFGAMADVTQIVQTAGNGTYTVSDFDLNDVISPYCPTGVNYGGWAIIIVYEEDGLGANQVNIYDGFEFVGSSNTSTSILLDNLNVVGTEGAKIGFLAWEGDDAISVNETLQLNGTTLSDPPLNLANNMFNGTNTYTGDDDLWNMDLDVLSIEDIIEVGDTQATITMTSGQDGVFLQHVATTISSELPDATVEITETIDEEVCDNRTIDFVATVYNSNSTEALPENTPVSLFVINENGDEVYLATEFTQNEIDIDDSEDVTFTVTIPDDVPLSTQIIVRVNDDGDGNNPINESNLE
ncbi:MAG: gliding motility-associated C-terminal domain-containing protein, partial [Bacteroidota bacterium]